VIDLATETLLTLETAAERLQVSKATLHRWITYGTKGVRLEAAKVGGRWRTSEEAIQRFSDCLTPRRAPTTPQQTPVSTSKQRQRHLELVNQQLDEMLGIRRCETCKMEIKAPGRVISKHERVWCANCLVQRGSATMGLRIRTFRWAASMTQEELSHRTGISNDNIRAYERHHKEPPEIHVAKLIEVLGPDLVSNYAGYSQGDPILGQTDS
jgi:excisionase family DNA binding protein